MEQVTNFVFFEDRAKSLLKRWRKFYESNKDQEGIDAKCIKGFLAEINDDVTKFLIER